MVEKVRSLFAGGEWTFKKVAVSILFLAIVVVMVGFGIRPDSGGDALGGVAAVVNDIAIPLAEFRAESEQRERDLQTRFNDLPEAQRRMYTTDLRRQIMDRLVTGEVIYQAAQKRGVRAADGEIRDQLLSIPSFIEGGRFQRDRYKMYLQSAGLSPADFERQLRKQIVTQKIYELFLGASAPSREELRRNRVLANQKINVRFAELPKATLSKLVTLSDADVKAYLDSHAGEVDGYLRDNKIEFTRLAKYHVRDLVVRIDDKRPEEAARKLAEELSARANAKNFAELVTKHSDDPGTKKKGGDLGEREQGSLPAEFETPVLALKPGEVSKPIKIEGAYHVALLDSKVEGGETPVGVARPEIARKLLARGRQDAVLAEAKKTVESGDRKAIDALIARAGAQWQPSGDFDLSSPQIPKLGEGREIIKAVVETGRAGGLVKRLIQNDAGYVIVDVTSWKEVPDKPTEVDGLDRMVAYRKAEGPITAWLKEVEKSSSIQRNTRLFE